MGRMPERLAGPGARHDAEASPVRGQVADLLPMLPLEQRVEVETERQLDGLAGGAGRGDDDDPPLGMRRVAVSVGIGRKVMVAGGAHDGKLPACAHPSESRLQLELPEPVLPGPIERMNQIHLGDSKAEEIEAEPGARAEDRGPVAAAERLGLCSLVHAKPASPKMVQSSGNIP